MADVACFCGCCFSFAGSVGACPECAEAVTLTTASALAADGADGVESICIMHWNGLPAAEPVGWDALVPAVAGPRDSYRPSR
jgi:hypothetical protein